MLPPYRKMAAGASLPQSAGAQPVGVWDNPTSNLRGHSAGHFLTLLAQAYVGGDAFKTEVGYMVGVFGQCQAALNAMVGQPGGSVQLSGTGQYVALPAGVVSGLTDFTVACWVNPSQFPTWSRVFDFGTGTTDYMFLTVNAGRVGAEPVEPGGVVEGRRDLDTAPSARGGPARAASRSFAVDARTGRGWRCSPGRCRPAAGTPHCAVDRASAGPGERVMGVARV